MHETRGTDFLQAIMLSTLAMKKVWQNKRKAAGKDYSRPNIVMNSVRLRKAIHVPSRSRI